MRVSQSQIDKNRFCVTSSERGRANDGIRTRDLLITNQLLYQLSYIGICGGDDAPQKGAKITIPEWAAWQEK